MDALNERHRNEAERFANSLWDNFESSARNASMSVNDDSLPYFKANQTTNHVFKASRSDPVFKIRINGKRRVFRDKTDMVAAVCRSGPKPNVSRRPPSNILYAFPSFDKCDSLLYLPSTMARHLNTGDMVALTKLYRAHLDKNCDFEMSGCFSAVNSLQQLIKTYELMDDLQPGRIMCVHTTKVVENQIIATIYLKFTDCKAIYDRFSSSVQHRKHGGHLITGNRVADLQARLVEDPQLSAEMMQKYMQLVETADDFVVYITLNMAFTFDNVTKKVTKWACEGTMTSMHAVQTVTGDLCVS